MDEKFLALHGLAVCKAGSAEDIAAVTSQDTQTIAHVLEKAEKDGFVATGAGRCLLTPAGRAHLDSGYAHECAREREDADFTAGYAKFEPINRQLLDLFTRWQTISTGGETMPNDHSDPDYDAKIINELGDLHERAGRVLILLSKSLSRISAYHGRLDSAYDKVLAGDHDYVSGVRVDSYHTVWFQLHEDLLRMLGRTREEA